MQLSSLNEKYGIKDKVEFKTGIGNLPFVEIQNGFGKVDVSIYGAQVLSYQPPGNSEVLWISEKSNFEIGKAIRGGIPICFPWFGPHPVDLHKPAHGFARLKTWNVKSVNELSCGSIQLVLNLSDDESTRELWQFSFQAEVVITLGKSLEVALRCTNTDEKEFTYSDALHSYFYVGDIEEINIHGLHNSHYYDGVEGKELIKQKEKILKICKEENRRYVDTTAECIIEDTIFGRKIKIGKKGSRTTVVWNPWKDAGKKFSDMSNDGYRKMICIESANAYSDVVRLSNGESHSLSTIISVEEL